MLGLHQDRYNGVTAEREGSPTSPGSDFLVLFK